jgi:tRNA (uracil-5-)-methyltransferase
LELYCGNGNHSVALASFAGNVVSVDINPALCEAARCNLERNSVNNVRIVQADSAKFSSRMLRFTGLFTVHNVYVSSSFDSAQFIDEYLKNKEIYRQV